MLETFLPPSSIPLDRQASGAERRRNPRPNEVRVLELFGRLRGPAELLRDGDREPLREHLVMIHAPLVEHCARSLSSSEDLLEDLVQEGNIGLIKAVDRYNPEKGVRFSTYACHLITGEMRHYLRDLGKMIHEPGWHSELRRQVERAAEDLVQRLGRIPLNEEIANALDMQPQIVRKVLESSNTLSVSSLDAEEDDDESPSKVRLYNEGHPTATVLSTAVENRVTLGEALPQLREQEKRAVTMFYYGEKTKTEVARELGVSVNYAAYLIKKGLEQLRKIIESEAPQHLAAPPLPATIPWNDLARWINDNKTTLSRLPNAAYDETASATASATAYNDAITNDAITSGTLANNTISGDVEPDATPSLSITQTPPASQILVPQRNSATNASAPKIAESDQKPRIEYSILLFRIANWREVTAHLDEKLTRESDRLVAELTRRSCRKADKVVAINGAPFDGLTLVALVGGGEIVGQRVRERWMKACETSAIAPTNAVINAEMQKQFAAAIAPRDGEVPQLVEKLASLARSANSA